MTNDYFTPDDKTEIQQLFGVSPENLEKESFKKTLRDLRAKYHPDNFEKFGDDTIRQLASDRFKAIEKIAAKIEDWFNGKVTMAPPSSSNTDPIFDKMARFGYREMKIEIRTRNKDLKYVLFGTFYRWLMLGDKFKIPETNAWVIADEAYTGVSIGFNETIRLYLTFDEKDSVQTIVQWFFQKISGHADSLIIEGEIIPVKYEDILLAIKRRSFLRIG